MTQISSDVYNAVLDHFDNEQLNVKVFKDRELLELIFFMLIEQRKEKHGIGAGTETAGPTASNIG